MQSKYFFYFLIFNLTWSCQSENKKVVESWENGKDKKVHINEKTFSFETNYFEEGHIESKGIIQEEKKEKDWIYFFPNGKIKQEIFYRQGKPFENAKYFYENGNLKSEGKYDETGLKTGLWISNSASGKVLSKGNYSLGRKVGKWSYFSLDGILEKEEELDNFGRHEQIKIYNDNGDLVRYSDFYLPNGIKSEFHKIDSISNKILFRSYHKNGNIELEGTKLNSREIGLWTYWHKNGIKKAQGKFLENIDQFKYENVIQIAPNILSKLPLQRTMSGLKIGKWEYWNNDGKKVAVTDSTIKGNKIVDKLIYVNNDLLE